MFRRGIALWIAAISVAACGRLGYDSIAIDAGGGRGGAGGLAGTGGSMGAAGTTGVGGTTGAGGTTGTAGTTGTVGTGGTAGSVGTGTGGLGGTTGAAGTTGSAGTGGSDGGAGITCFTQTFNGRDYAFCDAKVDWTTARAECEQRGMRLARIDDVAENDWIVATAVFTAAMYKRDALWIGGYEPTTDGDWHWTDGDAFWSGAANGTAVGGRYTNWDSREPNNAVGPESCVAIPLNNNSFWFDWQCTVPQYFVCERY